MVEKTGKLEVSADACSVVISTFPLDARVWDAYTTINSSLPSSTPWFIRNEAIISIIDINIDWCLGTWSKYCREYRHSVLGVTAPRSTDARRIEETACKASIGLR